MDQVLKDIAEEVVRARAKFPEGEFETRNDFIAYAVAYMGRAAEHVVRNERDNLNPRDMLIKAAGLIVAAIDKEFK